MKGKKIGYSLKEIRQAEHIAQGYLRKGAPRNKAWSIAWAVVRKKHPRGRCG